MTVAEKVDFSNRTNVNHAPDVPTEPGEKGMNSRMSSIGWEAFITGSQREILPSMGWKIDLFGHGQRNLNLRTKVPDWEDRTWADQIFLQAAYGFQKDGTIVLTLEEVRNSRVLESLLHGTRRETPQGAYPEPGWALPRADTRIRKLLKNHTRWESMNAQNDTIAWIGPDGSIILTCPEGWGIPSLVEREPAPYYEFGEKGKICPWQLDQGQQPRWATSPQPPPRDGLHTLGEEWQVESVTESHGITHTRHRRKGLTGDSILETEDGQHLLRWHTKHTRNQSTWKTNPLGEPGWTITITVSSAGNAMAKTTSKRDGETVKLGSSWNQDIAYLIAHDYVRLRGQKAQE